MTAVTALIADDEPLLREVLRSLLARHWPELQIVAEARNGVEALERFEALRPTVCFLDVHMPGLSGIEVAQRIGHRAHLVFITAYDHYALQAFERCAAASWLIVVVAAVPTAVPVKTSASVLVTSRSPRMLVVSERMIWTRSFSAHDSAMTPSAARALLADVTASAAVTRPTSYDAPPAARIAYTARSAAGSRTTS